MQGWGWGEGKRGEYLRGGVQGEREGEGKGAGILKGTGEGGRGRERERTQNSELYYSRIEILGSSLFLKYVLLSYTDNTHKDY